jgi:hypothetical protein
MLASVLSKLVKFSVSISQQIYPARIQDVYKILRTPARDGLHTMTDLEADIVRTFFDSTSTESLPSKATFYTDTADSIALQYNTCVASHILTTGTESDFTKLQVLRLLYYVKAVSHLRKSLSELSIVPVLGVQKSGKSTLFETITGRKFGAGARNTRLPSAISIRLAAKPEFPAANLTLVDFPGCNDGLNVYFGLGSNLLRVSAGTIIVLSLESADVGIAQELLACATGVGTPKRVLVCLNKLDVVFSSARRNYMKRHHLFAAEPGSASDDDCVSCGGDEVTPPLDATAMKQRSEAADSVAAATVLDKLERVIQTLKRARSLRHHVEFRATMLPYRSSAELQSSVEAAYPDPMSDFLPQQLTVSSLTAAMQNLQVTKGSAYLPAVFGSGTTGETGPSGLLDILPCESVAYGNDIVQWLRVVRREWAAGVTGSAGRYHI